MDIGKFKKSRARLTAWVVIPPVLIVGVGLSSFALKQQSEWQLERTRVLSELLPKIEKTQNEALALLTEFSNSDAGNVKSEEELISFLQNAARESEFTVDSLKVERKASSADKTVPVLVAKVRGSGSFLSVQTFIGDAVSQQQLLNETSLQISQGGYGIGEDSCRADIVFELIRFNFEKSDGGV